MLRQSVFLLLLLYFTVGTHASLRSPNDEKLDPPDKTATVEEKIGCLRWEDFDKVVQRTLRQNTFDTCRKKCFFYKFERFSFERNKETLKPMCQCIKRNDDTRLNPNLFNMIKGCSCNSQDIDKNSGMCVYHSDIRHNLPLSPIEVEFFNGDVLDRTQQLDKNLRLTLVIAHCDEDMSWMADFLTYDVKDVTIYSKCDYPTKNAPPGSKIVQLPNYGRCDHTYAHWMGQMKKEDATENHIVLFLKASRETKAHRGNHPNMHYRSLQDMVRIATVNGFSCGYKKNDIYFHDTTGMRVFALDDYKGQNIKSPYADMGHYLDVMGAELPIPICPVCYGGNFAAKATQIWNKRDVIKKIEESLIRGDSIEEGHFVERMWAGLLLKPLNTDEIDVLNKIPTKITPFRPTIGFAGRLVMLH